MNAFVIKRAFFWFYWALTAGVLLLTMFSCIREVNKIKKKADAYDAIMKEIPLPGVAPIAPTPAKNLPGRD